MRANGRKPYSAEFKREAEALVTQHGYTVVTATQNLGINRDMLRRWKRELARDGTLAFPGRGQQTPEQTNSPGCGRRIGGSGWSERF